MSDHKPRNHDAHRRTQRSVSDVKGVITQADMIRLQEALLKKYHQKQRRRSFWWRLWERVRRK